MPTYYIDLDNGNDTNNGSTWALAWKTVTSGATSARIAAGDVIRISKTPDPTAIGNCTWNNLSKEVTIPSGLCVDIDLCESGWVTDQGANVTVTNGSTTQFKQGSGSTKVGCAAAATTGLIAHKQITEIDLSGYQQVSFWIRSSIVLAAADLRLCLCSDTAGTTAVNTIDIPALPVAAYWANLTVDTGAALGSSIKSVALYQVADKGAFEFYIDNIFASLDSSEDDSITLRSLISKNSLATGGAEAWYPIQSISGTTVLLDNGTDTLGNAGRGYSGDSGTGVATYKRETFRTVLPTSYMASVSTITESGNIGSRTTFSFGWEVNGTQNGETFLDGTNGTGIGWSVSSRDFTITERLSMVRYCYGHYVSGAYHSISGHTISGTQYSINETGTLTYLTMNYANVVNNSQTILLSYCHMSSMTFGDISNNIGVNGHQFNFLVDCSLSITKCINNVTGPLFGGVTVKGLTDCQALGSYKNHPDGFLENATITDSPEFTNTIVRYMRGRVFSYNHDNTAGNHWCFDNYATVNYQDTVYHGASGYSWLLQLSSSIRTSDYPFNFSIAQVAVNANALVTVKLWMYRSTDTLAFNLLCRGGQIAGVTTDESAGAASTDTWEEVTITFTPTVAGVVQIEVQAYLTGGAPGSYGYFDDLSVSQA